jgi:hypothetical protein
LKNLKEEDALYMYGAELLGILVPNSDNSVAVVLVIVFFVIVLRCHLNSLCLYTQALLKLRKARRIFNKAREHIAIGRFDESLFDTTTAAAAAADDDDDDDDDDSDAGVVDATITTLLTSKRARRRPVDFPNLKREKAIFNLANTSDLSRNSPTVDDTRRLLISLVN